MAIPKIACFAIIIEDDGILLIKKNSPPEENKFALPGGTSSLEIYSDPLEAVKDEAAYYLGVRFNVDYFYKYSFYLSEKTTVIALLFIGSVYEVPRQNPDEVSQWKYYSYEEFKKLNREEFAFDHYEILDEFFRNENDKLKKAI